MKVLIIVLAVLVVVCIYFAFWLPQFIMTGKRQTIEEALQWQDEHYDVSFYNELNKTDYIVKGFEGYDLHVQFLKNPVTTTKYMILTHGYTDNHIGTLKYAKMYMDLGFNCVIYDLRGHGDNERTFTTYGIREAKDLICIIDDTKARYGDLSILGLHGESLGSATTITSLKYKPQVDFVVADCGFSDIENVIRNGYKNLHLPTWLFDIANFTGKIRYHYVLKDMRPIDSLDNNEVPILFIHGAEDSLIPPKNSEDMAKRTKGYSEVHLIPEAEHALSIITAPEEYNEHVTKFLKTIKVIDL